MSPAYSQQNDKSELFIGSAYHPVQVRYHDAILPEEAVQPGGAIEQLGDRYLGVTGAGAFFQIQRDRDADSFRAERIPLQPPHAAAAFDAVADPVVNRDFFRVIDLVARKTDNGWQLFASHHQWLQEQDCLVMRISATRLNNGLQPVITSGEQWQTIYDTTPCLTLDKGNRGRIFAGHESGGRMAWLSPGQLLFTTGDQEHDGWNQPVVMSQSDQHMYGKVMLVDVDKSNGTIFSKGHRNPQGLFIDDEGNIWETEHGPRGGDELNLVIRGRNYGWPEVTYGTDYGRFVWPPAAKVGDHQGFEQPVYAFVPSIGVSNLIRLGDSQFTEWRGNLLVSSLGMGTLYRLALDGTRVVYAEPLEIARRIRDIAIGPDGEIWLWGERGDLVTLSIADIQDNGALLFQTCAGCHTTGVTSGGLAPSLFRIVGRKIAARTDYVYSASFKTLEGVWTEERLDEFLQNPTAFAPGTTMNSTQVTDPNERRAIIEYLRDLW
jgi:cytochrome c2